MDWKRLFRHAFATRGSLLRAFPDSTLSAIESAVTGTEQLHSGEVRFAIEAALDPSRVWRGHTPRQRALEVFAALGVWDTAANNGVLIYVLLADRDVEIVADRGFNGRVSFDEWQAICVAMDARFRAGDFESGAVECVRRVGEIVARHFPVQPGDRNPNELPNRPTLL
jgi:uncharacterized membrane protein